MLMLQNVFHLFLIPYEHTDTTLFNTKIHYITRADLSSYVYGVFGAQRSRNCTVTVLMSQIKIEVT